MFTWIPLYKEMATWILPYRNKQEELCSILRKTGFEGNLMDQNSEGETDLKVMDPLTFFAFFQKSHNLEKRSHFLAEFKKISGLHSPVPTDFNGLPSAQPFNVRFFKYEKDRKGHELNLLWDLSEQAIKGELKEETFNAVLSMHGIGVAKLTQALFWLNPEIFYPIDSHKNYLDKIDSNLEIHKLSDYKKILEKIKILYPQKMHELSYDAWKNNQNEIATDISDRNNPDTLKQYNPEKYQLYIELIRRIIGHYNLKKSDARIVFSVRPRKLKFIIGQRSCLILYNNKGITHFGFIAEQKIDPDAETFNGPITAYFNYTDSISDLAKYENDIIKAIGPELNRTRQSSHMERDDPDFRNIVFEDHTTNSLDINNYTQRNLNTILFGPPGTGKTYLSKRLALSIIKEMSIDEISVLYPSPKAVSDEFEIHQKSGQIAFTTFHQSFSYEDFIEGIKPVLDGELKDAGMEIGESSSNQIGYQIKQGIFKQIADQARSYKLAEENVSVNADKNLSIDLHDKQFFKMSLGNTQKEEGQEIYKYCVSNDCIALGWGKNIDFTKADSNQKIDSLFEQGGGARSRYEITAVRCFRLWMKKGDIVLISEGNLTVRGIAQIESDYYFDPASPIGPKHFRKIKWLIKDARIPVNELYEKQFSQQTVYMLWNEEIKRDFFTKSEVKVSQNRNHVMIIDEINRGNISAIFGELITLIEEDKREGRKETIKTILPYSKTTFSVPDNLYIVGTMNTADRSVEALDTALRRRFTFEEMPPRYDLPELNKIAGNHTLKDILKRINIRLEKLMDKDHKIGHSYFMFPENNDTVSALMESFYKNIIPLLQEYFFGDYGKIGLVLGQGFVTIKDQKEKIFCAFDYDGADMLLEKPVYSIVDFRNPSSSLPDGMTFSSALDALMENRI